VLFGRPPKLTPHQRREAIARRDGGDETLADIARSLQRQPQHDQPLAPDRGAPFLGREEFQAGSRVQQMGQHSSSFVATASGRVGDSVERHPIGRS
jgi:hypothetical protein